jgi:hypothetical protein
MRWEGNVASMGEEGKLYRVLVGKPKEETTWKTEALMG